MSFYFEICRGVRSPTLAAYYSVMQRVQSGAPTQQKEPKWGVSHDAIGDHRGMTYGADLVMHSCEPARAHA